MSSTLPSGLLRPVSRKIGGRDSRIDEKRRFSLDEEEAMVRAMLARLDDGVTEDPYEGPGSKSPPTLPGSMMTSRRTTLLSAK